MRKRKIAWITAVFFILMLCFTVLSRAAWQNGTAVVQVGRPESRTIDHTVKAMGKIMQNQEIAVFTEPGQRILEVCVEEGQKVQKGELLFTIDEALLEEEILERQQELEKQRLQTQDSKSQKDVSSRQKANAQAQAEENYSLSTGSANVRLARAKRNLTAARKALEEYRESNGGEEADSAAEEALEERCTEKQEAYIQAQQELTTLQWQIENAVAEALRQATEEAGSRTQREIAEEAGDEALLETVDPVRTQSSDFQEGGEVFFADGLLEDLGSAELAGISGTSGDVSGKAAWEETETGQTLEISGSSGEASGEERTEDWTDFIIEDIEPGEPDGTEAWEPAPIPETDPPLSLTEEDLAQIEREVRASWQTKLDAAQAKVEAAKQEKEAADAALAAYQQERLAALSDADSRTEQQLIEQVQTAKDAYQDAALAANEAAVTSGRAVISTALPEASNSSDRMNEITCEQMELSLEKLQKLREAGGEVTAPEDGLVTEICITAGEKTLDTTAVRLAALSKGSRFTAEIGEEQEQYIGTGDLITVTSANGKKSLEAEVVAVSADEGDGTAFQVTARLPEDAFEIGAAAAMEYTCRSATYEICVPISALHLDERNQPYVLVTDECETIMGTELQARKLSVTVLEQNERYAALAEGVLSSRQDIITASDRAVDDGSRIRIGGS